LKIVCFALFCFIILTKLPYKYLKRHNVAHSNTFFNDNKNIVHVKNKKDYQKKIVILCFLINLKEKFL